MYVLDVPALLPMFGQLWCADGLRGAAGAAGVVWLFGAVCVFGVVVLGDEAAMATAPHVPPAATASAAVVASTIRVDFCNRSPFSRLRRRRDRCTPV
jgi:hypothetical protein